MAMANEGRGGEGMHCFFFSSEMMMTGLDLRPREVIFEGMDNGTGKATTRTVVENAVSPRALSVNFRSMSGNIFMLGRVLSQVFLGFALFPLRVDSFPVSRRFLR